MARERAIPTVLDRLIKAHGDETEPYLIEEYFRGYGEGIFERMEAVPPEQGQMLIGNANEWLLAEGELEVEGERVPAMSRAIELAGAEISDDQRQWLEAVAAEPLDLYEVVEGGGAGEVRLQSLLRADLEPRTVSAANLAGLPPGVRLGLRAVPWDGGFKSTFALYGFPTDADFDLDDLPELARHEMSRLIVDAWLTVTVGPTVSYEVADGPLAEGGETAAAGKEPRSEVFLDQPDAEQPVTDLYQVRDRDALLEALGASERIAGGSDDGWSLAAEEGDEPAARFRLEGETFTVSAGSIARADAGQDWLLEETGAALRFEGRQIGEME